MGKTDWKDSLWFFRECLPCALAPGVVNPDSSSRLGISLFVTGIGLEITLIAVQYVDQPYDLYNTGNPLWRT